MFTQKKKKTLTYTYNRLLYLYIINLINYMKVLRF